MRKITSLLMLLCVFAGTAWGQLPTVSNAPSNGAWAEGTKWYTIKQNDKNFVSLGNADANGYLMLNSTDAKGAAALWCVVGNETDGYQLYNYSAGASKVLGAYGSEANGRMKMYDLDATKDGSNTLTKTFDIVALEGQTGFAFVKNHGSTNDWWNSRDNYLAYWNSGYAYDANCDGSKYTFTEITDFETLIDIPATKTAAKAELEAMVNISAIFPALTTEKEQIDAITPATNSLSDLNSAYEKINAILVNYKQNANGKNVKLSNLRAEPDTRYGRFIGYDKANNRAAAIEDGGDAAIWTIKSNADGTFKMYNFVSNLYLGIPGSNNGNTPMHASESDAAAMSIIPTGVNALALVSGGKMAHCANNNNYRIMHYWDTNDGASLWQVELSDPIVVSREIYDAAAAAKSTLPYAIQQAYGLVTDAKNYYSNWKSDAEGSYEALLDNNTGTFFHSSYTDEAKAETADAHYIQANLGTAIGEFYFYMSPRTQNGNNRPINITVSGSNTEDGQFTKIADVTTTLDGSTNPYFSAKLGAAGTKYQYIRLTVNSTNNDTKFFTLSELYFLPSNSDVDNLLVSYANFASSSITSANMASAANALINAEGVLALSNIKKEIKAILDANVSNHAATPALGQYSTAAYNALKTAYESSKATQESLETALAAFNNSKNIPVYFITSAQEGYAKGSAIYYDGEWKWKAANKFDRQMWMTIPSYAQANVPVVDKYDANGTSYEICDYLTGTVMREKKVQIVKVPEWDGVVSLQYNANSESLDAAHHAKDNGQLVNWKPAKKDDCQASAWRVEYIGTSYELANLTDEKIQALAALKTAYDTKAYYKNAVMGDGVGQYKGNKDAIVAELAKAEAVYMKTISQQANMTVEEINAIAKSITDVAGLTLNMPTPGFYTVKSLGHKNGMYVQTNAEATGLEFAADKADVRSIVYFGADKTVLSFGTGRYINDYEKIADVGAVANTWTIAENPKVVGAYSMQWDGQGYWLSDWTGKITYGQNDASAAWMFEEVAELPITISPAGYATFYCPVAVTLPEGLNAYYVSSIANGKAQMTKISEVIPANTGVVLQGEPKPYTLTIGGEADGVTNLLDGTVASTYVELESYVLSQNNDVVGFYKAAMNFAKNGEEPWAKVEENGTHFLNNGFKAYLPASAVAAAARFIGFDFGTETAIDELNGEDGNVKTVIYDLSGRRVQKAQKGVFIVNGKVVIK